MRWLEVQHQDFLVQDAGMSGLFGFHTRICRIDTGRSAFLNLLWDERSGEYQLFQFPVSLPDATAIRWRVDGRRLVGLDESNAVIMEWYGFSGGQLKYYPQIELAKWRSERFFLEPLPESNRNVILEKAAAYYPDAWKP